MPLITFILAGLILLGRVFVPIGNTALSGWPARFSFFILWCLLVGVKRGDKLNQLIYTLKSRWFEVSCYTIWIAVLALFWVSQGGEHYLTSTLLLAYIATIPFYVLGCYYHLLIDDGKLMSLLMVAAMGASCFIAIPSIWQNPEIVRLASNDAYTELRTLGIGGYGDNTGFACILPFTITIAIESKNVQRIIGIASSMAIIGYLMLSTFSGLMLLAILAVIGSITFYSLLGGLRTKRILVPLSGVIIIGMLLIFVFPYVYERDVFRKFYDKLSNTIILAPSIIAGQEDDPTSRYTLMLDSLNVFLNYPLLGAGITARGIGTGNAGGHSSWFDALANYGLIGCMPYMMFHFLVMRRVWLAWRNDRKSALHWGVMFSCVLYIFYGIFNVTTQVTTICLFMYVAGLSGQALKGIQHHQDSFGRKTIRTN